MTGYFRSKVSSGGGAQALADRAHDARQQAREAGQVADKICNLLNIATCPPSDWLLDQRREYFEWARLVVDQLRGTHPRLEWLFDEVYESGLEVAQSK